MSYRLCDHTADVAVEATGASLDELFGALADGLAAATCESIPPGGERFDLAIEAEGLEAACFDYLDELVYERDVRGVLPADNEATVEHSGDRWTVTASARGVPLDRLDAREIKAVTYSEMDVAETDDGWSAYVVFDV